jgi:hypothetical protein
MSRWFRQVPPLPRRSVRSDLVSLTHTSFFHGEKPEKDLVFGGVLLLTLRIISQDLTNDNISWANIAWWRELAGNVFG